MPSFLDNSKPSKASKKRGKRRTAPSISSATKLKEKLANTSQPISHSKLSLLRSASNEPLVLNATQRLPLIVGSTYLKVENIDLEKLSVFFGLFIFILKKKTLLINSFLFCFSVAKIKILQGIRCAS